jgi:hypothetical protein
MNLKISTLLLFTYLITSCQHHNNQPIRAYYYWKSAQNRLTALEVKHLQEENIQKLYVKVFEVDQSYDENDKPYPSSKTELYISKYELTRPSDHKTIEIVPTVFVSNSVLGSLSNNKLSALASNIVSLVTTRYNRLLRIQTSGDSTAKRILTQHFDEIQIDCDWTEKTKDKYFYLLKQIKQFSNAKISCTLRLYPYKYRSRMGIPPVDKVTLMCYNLTNPLKEEEKNSILDPKELELYLKNTEKYPIHTDIALPLFSWMHLFRNGQHIETFTPKPHTLDTLLKPIKQMWYEVKMDYDGVYNYYLRVGDKIKYEETTPATIEKAIDVLNNHLKLDSTTTITLFHLDSENLKEYPHETIHRIFTDFNR